MESLQHLKSRLRAVKNVGQITKAMEVVAATKMRRAQEIALNSRAYAYHALNLLEKLAKNSPIKNPFTENRAGKKTLLIIISSDKGLAGSFNTQVLKTADKFLTQNNLKAQSFSVIAIGKKSLNYAIKKKFELAGNFTGVGDYAKIEEISPLSDLITQGFLKQDWDKVFTISTHFQSALKQETLIRQILPVDFEKIRETVKNIVPEKGRYSNILEYSDSKENQKIEYIFEPSPEEAINSLIPHLIKMQIYHLILEANASEHSARRVAMKTASDNADELAENLNLTYNKARQSNITNELIEITSTQNALN